MFKDIIRTARPNHYFKNFFVFAALIFSQQFLELNNILLTVLTFISFCLAASAVYFLNDIFDKEEDKQHPEKKNRPIASGRISIKTALVCYFLLFASSLLIPILFINLNVAALIFVYIVMNVFYSWKLKHIVIIDLFLISAGFVLRVLVGGLAIGVPISDWLLMCVILLSLFLAIAKRREEFVNSDPKTSKDNNTRKVLTDYNKILLDQMIGVVSSLTIISYSLYTILNTNYDYLIATIPFVIYGIFRYLHIIYVKKGGGKPEKEMLKDKHILLDVFLWGIVTIVIIVLFN